MKDGYVYIMCNRGHGILYVGVTTNLCRRVYEHRQSVIKGFSKKYDLHRLASSVDNLEKISGFRVKPGKTNFRLVKQKMWLIMSPQGERGTKTERIATKNGP